MAEGMSREYALSGRKGISVAPKPAWKLKQNLENDFSNMLLMYTEVNKWIMHFHANVFSV